MDTLNFKSYIKKATPQKEDSGFIGNFIPSEKYLIGFDFDNRFSSFIGRAECSTSGKIYFTIGFNGLSLNCTSEGYVTTDIVLPESESEFTFLAWIKLVSFPSQKSVGNSVIISNKSADGDDSGFVLSVLTEDKASLPQLRLSLTDKSGNTAFAEAPLPENCRKSWVHVTASFSSEKIRLFVNFSIAAEADNTLVFPVVSDSAITIARDITGENPAAFESELDDLLIRRGAIQADEIVSLKNYYLSPQ